MNKIGGYKDFCSWFFFIKHLFAFILTSDAAVVTWIGGTGNWDDKTNWDTGSVPTNDDGAIINNGIVNKDSYTEANYIHLINLENTNHAKMSYAIFNRMGQR